MKRELVPEILDGLAPDDPQAIRSRRDLRVINALMGNERWILRQLAKTEETGTVVEWGAGEGTLISRAARHHAAVGVDLVPKPAGVPENVHWRQGDVFEVDAEGGTLMANLFLHHFDEAQLARLGERVRQFDRLICVEPLRTPTSLNLGRGMLPFVGLVTRHDMLVSIRAGFVAGELPCLLGLEQAGWKVSERCSWRGGLRVLASRA